MVLKRAWSYSCSALTDFWCSIWLPAVLMISGGSLQMCWSWEISAAGSNPSGSWLWPFVCLSPATGNETDQIKGHINHLWLYSRFLIITRHEKLKKMAWFCFAQLWKGCKFRAGSWAQHAKYQMVATLWTPHKKLINELQNTMHGLT